MSDNTRYGDPSDFDVSLHSIYAAYLGLFESSGTDWWDKSWGGYFTSFGEFLGFGWEAMVVVDSGTSRPHIAVRREQIVLFAKMIRTRFGESLSKDPPTTLPLSPVPIRTLSLRRLVVLNDLASYRKLAQTLQAAELSYLRSRIRNGEVGVTEQLFYAGGSNAERERGRVGVRDNGVGYSWACVRTTWWEKGGPPQGLIPGVGRTQVANGGKGLVLEVGTAVLRCANLRAVNVWPPVPEENYRKSHCIIEEWVDKRTNSNPSNKPRAYAFGKSRYVAEKNIERIVDATISAIASPDNDSNPNALVLLSIGDPLPLPVPASSALPANILHLDVLSLEYHLLRRAQEQGIPGTPDRRQPLNSLAALLQTLQIPVPPFAPLGNAGNEAFYTLLAFQKLMMAETRQPNMLFSQYHQPYAGLPGHASMRFAEPPWAQIIPPFARPEHLRESSASSHRRSDYFLPVDTANSPNQLRRASAHSRPRPSSMGETSPKDGLIPRSVTPEAMRQPDSAPPTVRGERRPMSRSQTVYLNESDNGDRRSHDAGDFLKRSERESFFRPSLTIERDAQRSQMPPSAMRSGSGGSSRSISWEAATSRDPVRTTNSASSPLRGGRPMAQVRGTSGPSLNKEAAGSSNRLSSGSERRSSDEGRRSSPAAEEKERKGKMKSDRSVKDLAGAITRFWLG